MRVPFCADDPLFVLRQLHAKPSHSRPPCQNHAVLLDGDWEALYNNKLTTSGTSHSAPRGE